MKKIDWYDKVYEIVKQIPQGKVATYGQIASLLGKPRWARMVGQALHHAPYCAELPCHRVVNHQGRLAPHWTEQRDLLRSEHVIFKENGCVDLKLCLWKSYKNSEIHWHDDIEYWIGRKE